MEATATQEATVNGTSEELREYGNLRVGDRVTGPGPRPSSPREPGTLRQIYVLYTARSKGIWARVEREDGSDYTTAIGLVAKASLSGGPYTSRHAGQSLRREPAPATRFTREQFTSSDGTLAACASDLGWHAGVWPDSLTIDGVLYTRGRVQVDRREGELLSVTYNPANINHPSLTLFND